MKKQLTLALTCAFAAMSANAAVDWTVVSNIAKGTTVEVSSNDGAAATITDDNNETRWQGFKPIDGANDWALIDLGSEQSFDLMEIFWEASHPLTYDVYVVNSKPTYTTRTFTVTTAEGTEEHTEEHKVIDDAWLSANTATKVDLGSTADAYYEPITGTFKGQYILIYAKTANNSMNTYGMSLWEFRAGTIGENANALAKLQMNSASIIPRNSADITVTAFDVIGNAYDVASLTDLTVTTDAAVTITKKSTGVYTVTAATPGIYTLTATATADGKTVTTTSTLTVAVDWSKLNNVALNKPAYASHNATQANLSVDGDVNTRWGVGENVSTGTWYYVDLGGEYVIKNIAPIWETAYCSDYKYYYATETETVDGVEQPKWIELAHIQKTLAAANNYTDTYALQEAVTARYIKLECIKSEVWGMSFYEFMIDGASVETPVATTLEFTASPANGLIVGEASTLAVAVKDQFGSTMDITPTLAITSGEGTLSGTTFTSTAKGATVIKATAGDLTKEITINTVTDEASFIPTDAMTAEADAKNADGNDSGKGAVDSDTINKRGVATWESGRAGYGENEAAGAHEHWLIVDLGRKYNLDMIATEWEGASSNNYDIIVAETKEDLATATPLYTINDAMGVKARNDRFYGKAMNNVRYIKLASHSNASQYGLNLFEMRMYGELAEKLVATSISTTTDLGGNVLFMGDAPESATLSSTVIDQFGDVMTDQTVTYALATAADGDFVTLEGNKITAKANGVANLIATCGSVTENILFTVTSADRNLRNDGNQGYGYASILTDIYTNRYPAGFDGDDNTVVELGKNSIHLMADCGNGVLLDVEAVTIKWERACPSEYSVYLVTKQADYLAGIKPDPIYSVSGLKKDGNSEISFTDRIAVNPADLGNDVFWVVIEAKGNAFEGFGKNLYEIGVYGEKTDTTVGVNSIEAEKSNAPVDVYNISGTLIRENVMPADATLDLAPGFYIVGNKKVLVK